MKPARKIEFTRDELRAIRANKGKRPSAAFVAAKLRSIRGRLNLSQSEFATMLRVSRATLQNWEQARCTPEGPALTLLLLVDRAPDNVSEILKRTA